MPYWERGVDEWVPQDVPGEDAQDLPPPAAMAQLPAKEDRVLTMLLEKKVGAGHLLFQMREMVLTSSSLLFARPGVDMVIDIIDLLSIKTIKDLQADFGAAHHSGEEVIIVIQLRGEEDLKHDMDNPPDRLHDSMLVENGGDRSPSTTALARSGSPTTQSFSRSMSTRALAARSLRGEGEAKSKIKTYMLRASTPGDARVFHAALCKTWAAALADQERALTHKEYIDNALRRFYKSPKMHYAVFTMIVINFFINCLNFELLPEPESLAQSIFDWIDLSFNCIFSAELMLTMYVCGPIIFMCSGFNLLDLSVVAISWVALLLPSVKNVSVLRLFRVSRIVRIARRMTSLITLARSLSGAVLPIVNTFLVILMVSGLYSVLCVMLFADTDPLFFGKVSLSLFTLFQVSSGDGWVQNVVRPMMSEDDGEVKSSLFDQIFPVLFFISYYIIISVVLFNIVVAILLDEFMQAATAAKERQKAERVVVGTEMTLDPLMKKLNEFATPGELAAMIDNLYKVLDIDDNGGVAFDEMRAGLRNINHEAPLLLTEEDWHLLTEHGKLCNEDGELTPNNFRVMLQRQLGSYIQRQLSNAMKDCDPGKRAILSGLKLQLLLLHRGGLDDLEEQEEVHEHHQQDRDKKDVDQCNAGLGHGVTEILTSPNHSDEHKRTLEQDAMASDFNESPLMKETLLSRLKPILSANLEKLDLSWKDARQLLAKLEIKDLEACAVSADPDLVLRKLRIASGPQCQETSHRAGQSCNDRWAALDARVSDVSQKLDNMQTNQGLMLLALQRVEHLLRSGGEEGECHDDIGHPEEGEQERWGLVRARNTQSTLTRSKATPLIKQARGRTTKRSTAQTSSATESAVEEGGRQRTLSLSPDSFAIVSRWATSGRMGVGFTGGARPEGAPADEQALNEERPMTQPDSVTKQLAVAVMPAMNAQEQQDNKTASAATLTAAADVIRGDNRIQFSVRPRDRHAAHATAGAGGCQTGNSPVQQNNVQPPPVQRANALAQEGDDLGTPPDTDKTEFRPRAEGSRAPLSQMRHLPARPAAKEDDSRQLRESAATSSLNLQPLEPLIDSPSRWALVDSLYKGYIG